MDSVKYIDVDAETAGSRDSGDYFFAALVDSVLQASSLDDETSTRESTETPMIDPQDRDQLSELYGELVSQYLDPIAQFIRMIQRGERSHDVLDNFRNLLEPVLQLTSTMEVSAQENIIRSLHSHILEMREYKGTFTYRHLAPLTELFDQFLNSLSAKIRDEYMRSFYYQRNSNPLLEEIRRVKFIGPRRIQRLYAVGLVTVDAISRATAQEIVDVTGISLKLSQQVIEVTRSFMQQERVNRARRLRGLTQELKDELDRLTERDRELYGALLPDILALLPSLNRTRGWLESNSNPTTHHGPSAG